MRLRISARRSDLARLQALAVGAALQNTNPDLDIQYFFRESLGDKNLSDPLWQMPERGVFTQDFVGDLIDEKTDLVVHSWKDLPLEDRGATHIAATLPRADQRDVLLVHRERWHQLKGGEAFAVYSSSPRRAHNLQNFLPEILPKAVNAVRFEAIRGNVQTRVRKFLESHAHHGLVVAKAALDRLLSATEVEFQETREYLRAALSQCLFMVLPLRENPTAAAQGALAVEIKTGRADLEDLLKKINHASTFAAVNLERKTLGSYGGGCHQKIGVSVLARDWGTVLSLRGLTDGGQTLNSFERDSDGIPQSPTWLNVQATKRWPEPNQESAFFDRVPVAVKIPADRDLWIARANALPSDSEISNISAVWCAGLSSWKALARRGIWVNGCAEGLGEQESPQIAALLGRPERWTKLTHEEGIEANLPTIATYRLVPKSTRPSFKGKTHFYWMSSSGFKEALRLEPSLIEGFHACGPGHTYDELRKILPAHRVRVFLSYEDWCKALDPK